MQCSLDIVAIVESSGEVAVVFCLEPLRGQARFDVDRFAV
jgi:hypothetical protein